MDLLELRNEIDKIDNELLKLFVERMNITKNVAKYKIENNIPVLNSQREDEILNSVAEKSGDLGDMMKIIFATIMDVSRANQHQIVGGGKMLRSSINNAKNIDISSLSANVVCAGVKGAYAGEASSRLFPNGKIQYVKDFGQVFMAVENKTADYGVIPVENSTAGSVHEVYDLIMKHKVFVVGAMDLPINHCLCAKKGIELKDIKKVYSHSQGLLQCGEFLEENNITAITHSNTAAAAKYVSENDFNDSAAVCSRFAANEYSLDVIAENVQTSSNNATRFIVISRDMIISDDADKISLIFSLPHTTGSLYRVLGRFSMYGLNLTKIESRPILDGNFSYNFYLDLSGNVRNQKTLDLLCALSDELPLFTFLGNYKEIK